MCYDAFMHEYFHKACISSQRYVHAEPFSSTGASCIDCARCESVYIFRACARANAREHVREQLTELN